MVDLLLCKQDYETLKSILTIVDPALEKKIDNAKQKTNKYVITPTLDELESLAEYIAAEANHEEDKIRQRKLDKLYDRVDAVLKEEGWEEGFKRLLRKIEDEIAEE